MIFCWNWWKKSLIWEIYLKKSAVFLLNVVRKINQIELKSQLIIVISKSKRKLRRNGDKFELWVDKCKCYKKCLNTVTLVFQDVWNWNDCSCHLDLEKKDVFFSESLSSKQKRKPFGKHQIYSFPLAFLFFFIYVYYFYLFYRVIVTNQLLFLFCFTLLCWLYFVWQVYFWN